MLTPIQPDEVLLFDASENGWLWFRRPLCVLSAERIEDVLPACMEVEKILDRGKGVAAGFLAYEAAPGFDSALHTRPASSIPLAWFGIYEQPEILPSIPLSASAYQVSPHWTASITRQEYDAAIQAIKNHIASGDTYQVNYTYRLSSSFQGDPLAYFAVLARAQKALYTAFVHTGRFVILSASPELFFSLQGQRISSRPMKGTAPRGRTLEEDQEQSAWLRGSGKNQAENVMIVDMVRNDIGRIARIGSVQVPELFTVEKYPTLWQMVSTVTGETSAGLSDICQALFPPASITGAPKPRTMQIIAGLETTPRQVYTGCIGYYSSARQAQFNVAIRTVLLDQTTGLLEYGVGGGITWDSLDSAEFEECQTKAKILTVQIPSFSLLESLLWTAEEGYFLLEYHLARLSDAAAYFSYSLDLAAIRRRLVEQSGAFGPGAWKVRILVDECGQITIEAAALPLAEPQSRLRICLAPKPVDSSDPFLYHKTTHRRIYEQARASCPDEGGRPWDDVLLWNERGEVTEACTSNILVELDGILYTPPVSCGLLPGTYRAWLLDMGNVKEKVVHIDDLPKCQRVYLINSVRKQREAQIP